jgi:predicted MPP superfamily phosphohydrolase
LQSAVRSLRGLNDWRLWGGGIITAFGLAFVETNGAWYASGRHALTLLQLALYWGLWLLWPLALLFLLGVISHLVRGRIVRALWTMLMLALVGALLWARFIEPRQLQVRETSIGTACGVRVALISDLHAGIFVRSGQLEHLVQQLNALDVDAVLVAGDWTYMPSRDLRSTFSPLASLRHRTYGVLGNHDEERPGPPLQAALRTTLQTMNVQLIEGQRVALGRCELAGVGDLYAGATARDLAALKNVKSVKPASQRVVLTHNPDSALDLEPNFAAVTLAGHTHGGQVDLPFATDWILKQMTRGNFKRGLYTLANTQVFVSSGTGMDHLPLRFAVPPTIDVLAL